jgi:hypothetical protein
MRHQPRAFASSGEGLKHGAASGPTDQYSGCGGSGRQHAGKRAPRHGEPAATHTHNDPGL